MVEWYFLLALFAAVVVIAHDIVRLTFFEVVDRPH
jgi:hypothetical protein